MKKKKLYG